jgi:hypothetical protein
MSNTPKPSTPVPTTKAELDNHAQQLDPSTDKYWKARGYPERPADWQRRLTEPETPPLKK